MARRPAIVPPLVSDHSKATQQLLKSDGLPIDAELGITSGGRVRHIVMYNRVGVDVLPSKDTLCNLFRPGTSLLRMATLEDNQPLCVACKKTLEAEVMRGKEAMRGEPDE